MENFQDVRSLPTGRAALFIPQLVVERRFKEKPDEEKKISLRFEDKISDALRQLQIPNHTHTEILRVANKIKEPAYRNQYALVIAAFIFVSYPNGIANPGFQPVQGQLGLESVRGTIANYSQHIVYKKNLLGSNSEVDNIEGDEKETRFVADVLAYHQLLNVPANRT